MKDGSIQIDETSNQILSNKHKKSSIATYPDQSMELFDSGSDSPQVEIADPSPVEDEDSWVREFLSQDVSIYMQKSYSDKRANLI